MKTSPTDVDREAARLFNPAPGMRVRAKMRDAEDSFWSCASRHTDVGGVFCDAEPTVDECKWVRQYEVAYITLTRAIALCDELAELRARVAGQP